MRAETSLRSRAARLALQVTIAVAGIIAIVGSGGGFPELDYSGIGGGSGGMAPSVFVQPRLRTVAVGDTATFAAGVFNAQQPAYQWRRNGVDIAGATGTTYTLVGANLGDDGAQFSIHVSASNGTASGTATLQVSPLPAILFQDDDFALADWSVSTISTPAIGGPAQTVSRNDTGGNPDAYRSIAYTMTTGPSSIVAFHGATGATYDPSAQGAIYGIDASVDCIKTGGGQVLLFVMFEQAGRRYDSLLVPCTVVWFGGSRLSLRATDFVLADGPACAAGATCPDFSATGAPLRFGLTATSDIGAGQPATSYTQGIDNWRVGVWRR
jgi:hypothetical protein